MGLFDLNPFGGGGGSSSSSFESGGIGNDGPDQSRTSYDTTDRRIVNDGGGSTISSDVTGNQTITMTDGGLLAAVSRFGDASIGLASQQSAQALQYGQVNFAQAANLSSSALQSVSESTKLIQDTSSGNRTLMLLGIGMIGMFGFFLLKQKGAF